MTRQEFIDKYRNNSKVVIQAITTYGYNISIDEALGKMYDDGLVTPAISQEALLNLLVDKGYDRHYITDYLVSNWPVIKINCSTQEEAISFVVNRLRTPNFKYLAEDIGTPPYQHVIDKVNSYATDLLIITEDSKAGHAALLKFIHRGILVSALDVCSLSGLDGIKLIVANIVDAALNKRIILLVDALGITGSIRAFNNYFEIKRMCSGNKYITLIENYMSFEYEVMKRASYRVTRVFYINSYVIKEFLQQSTNCELHDIPIDVLDQLRYYKSIVTTEKFISGLLSRNLDKNYKITKGDISTTWFVSCQDGNDLHCKGCKLKGVIPDTKADDVFGDIVKTFIEGDEHNVKSVTSS